MKILNFLKSFTEPKGLGYIENPVDTRDISLVSVQEPVSSPLSYSTDVSMLPILDQKRLGACVGHAFANYINYFETLEGRKPEISARYIYALSKVFDKYDGEGTYPRVAAGVLKGFGAATTNFVPNNTRLSHKDYIKISGKNDAEAHKVQAYAFVPNNIEMLKQAIYQNKLVAISIKLPQGRHYVLAYGYDNDSIYYVNSWGKWWGNSGKGKLSIKEGLFDVMDMITLVDITEKQKEEAKKPTQWKYFAAHEVYKLETKLVNLLDVARGIAGIPFVITSGYRSPAYNKKIGGSANSAHMDSTAVDLRCRNSSERFKIVNAAIKAGFTRIGVADNFIHLDISKRDVHPDNVMWTY